MPNEVKLLPCPFCGNEPKVSFSHEAGRWDVYEVECEHCIISIDGPHGFTGEAAKQAVIAAWNTRPTTVVTDEVVERDWTGEAARLSLDAADRPPVRRSTLGSGIQHAAWMLTEIEEGRISGNKAHRWLGYAQGLLVENGYLTLEEAKDANKIASEAANMGRPMTHPSPPVIDR